MDVPPPRPPSRPSVEPLDVTGVRTITVGTLLFVGAGLGLLPFHEWLAAHDRSWWLGTCAAGTGLGVFGMVYTRRRARRRPEHGGPAGGAAGGPMGKHPT